MLGWLGRTGIAQIDTWLAGTLRSFCEEHSWKSGSKGFHPPKGTKKSLFAAEDEGDGEGDGESEGEEQEADAEAEVGGNTEKAGRAGEAAAVQETAQPASNTLSPVPALAPVVSAADAPGGA